MSKLSKSLPYHLFVEGKNDLHVVSSSCESEFQYQSLRECRERNRAVQADTY